MPSPLGADHGRAVTLLSLAAFASAASARVGDPLLPELARQFQATPTDAGQVVSGFALSYGLLQAFLGPLGDRLGKYRLIALTTLACVLGGLWAALASSLDQLVLARILTGATAAGVIPLSMAWIGDTVAYEQRQPVLARFLIGQILGVIAGQFIGGIFADTLGWRSAFGFLASLYLIIGTLVWRESRRNPLTQALPPAKGVSLGIVDQMRRVLRLPWARLVLLTVFLEGALVFGPLALIPSHVHQQFGLSLAQAGLLMGVFGVGGLSYILFARHFVRRLGETGLSLGGGLLLALAWSMMAWAGSWGWALPAGYCAGLGYYQLHNTLQTNATQMAPEVRGTAVSLFASAFFVGQGLGVALSAKIMAGLGAVALYTAAALCLPLLGAGFAWSIQRLRPKPAI